MYNIDPGKLTRNYTQNPIKKGELLPESDLKYLYFELNLRLSELCLFFKCKRAFIRRNLEYYSLTKDSSLYRKNSEKTCLERYGSKSPLENEEIFNKTVQTCLDRYNTDNVFRLKQVKDKIKETLLRKYGTTNIAKVSDVKNKRKETIKKTYKCASPSQIHVKNKEIWYNDSLLTKYVKDGVCGRKYTTKELAEIFNISKSTVQVRIGSLSLWEFIDFTSSSQEEEIRNILVSLGYEPKKIKIDNIEFDIYLEDKNIAIEFNGNYWHSTRVRKDYKYHLNKSKLAEKHGIFLYHIFEYDWVNNQNGVLNQLFNLLGINTTKIFARKCIIKTVDKTDAHIFLDENHLQKRAASKVALGLYYNDELVSLMTFGKSRFNKNYQWELVRFCSKAGTNVVGGASKLFKYFVKTYNPTSIISYSDIAHTRGTIYNKLGFTQLTVSDPNYVWTNHNTVLSRYKCQKHILLKNGFGKLGNTEVEIMNNRHYCQIFDCGSRVHIWYNKGNYGNSNRKS